MECRSFGAVHRCVDRGVAVHVLPDAHPGLLQVEDSAESARQSQMRIAVAPTGGCLPVRRREEPWREVRE